MINAAPRSKIDSSSSSGTASEYAVALPQPELSNGVQTKVQITGTSSVSWGALPEVGDIRLLELYVQVQNDLDGLIEELRWVRGPLGKMLLDGQSFLGDLRKTFRRHHRRLSVHVRAEGGVEFTDRVRTELAELAEAFRVHVLTRASKVSHQSWSPVRLAEAIDRVLARVPISIEAQIEPVAYESNADSTWRDELSRWLLIIDRAIRDSSFDEPLTRTIDIRNLFAWHIYKGELKRLEGLSVLLIQSEAHLERRARNLFELIAQAFEDLISRPDELTSNLDQLKALVQEELELAEAELKQFVDDLESRIRTLISDALFETKRELPLLGTLRLPNHHRSVKRLVRERQKRLDYLLGRVEEVTEAACGGHTLLGLYLEVAAFKARTTFRLEADISDLERSVKGRSAKQITRVRAELDGVLDLLSSQKQDAPAAAQSEGSEPIEKQLPRALESLKRVVRDAQRAVLLTLEQLTSEQALQAPLEVVVREARGLTNYYRVPIARLAHSEWTLPMTTPMIELPLASVVAEFVETDIAPALLQITAETGALLRPLIDVLDEVDRVVSLGGGHLEGDDALVREAPEAGETYSVLRKAFENAQEPLAALEEPAELWARNLARSLRTAFKRGQKSLEQRFTEGELLITANSVTQVKDTPRPAKFWSELGRWAESAQALGQSSGRRLRAQIGEGRVANARRVLGLREEVIDVHLSDEAAAFEPPMEKVHLPPYYRRLFAGQATWVGDALEAQTDRMDLARRVLAGSQRGVLRTVAVVGAEGSGRRALLSSLTRGDRFGQLRSIAFTEPVGAQEVQIGLQELGQGQLVVVTGLSWLVSAGEGGFEGLRTLVDGVLADEGRNAFLIEADVLVWRWACSIAPMADLFACHVEVPQLDPRNLENILMERHRLSGLELRFGTSASDDFERSHFFARLHHASDGLLQLALAYWLGSLGAFEESENYVSMSPVPQSPHASMRALSEEFLHPLYLIARQGWMMPSVLAELLGRRESDGAALLARLEGMGLLERTPRGYYIIRRHLAGVLHGVLLERGWA